MKYTTSRGTQIELKIVTTEASIADQKTELPCYKLELTVNGSIQAGGSIMIIDHAEHGKCLTQRFSNVIIPIPTSKIAEAEAITEEYKAEISRMVDETHDRDCKHADSQRNVIRLMDV